MIALEVGEAPRPASAPTPKRAMRLPGESPVSAPTAPQGKRQPIPLRLLRRATLQGVPGIAGGLPEGARCPRVLRGLGRQGFRGLHLGELLGQLRTGSCGELRGELFRLRSGEGRFIRDHLAPPEARPCPRVGPPVDPGCAGLREPLRGPSPQPPAQFPLRPRPAFHPATATGSMNPISASATRTEIASHAGPPMGCQTVPVG